jgi:hypothetical protein
MKMAKNVTCPACGQADQVEKVSKLYITGIEMQRKPKDGVIQPGSEAGSSSIAGSFALSRRLAPPSSSQKANTRPIHPDLVVITFSLILPVFLYGIYTSQRPVLLPMVGILLLMYGAYFWKRKVIVARFERQEKERQAKDERIRRGITRWMRLYYCSRDDGVFEAGKDELVPADFMPGYLLRE